MATTQEIVKTYLAACNEHDEAARRRLLEQSWANNATYTASTVHVEGRDALVKHIGGFFQRYPGGRFVLASGVDEHHGMLRFAWKLLRADGSTQLEGIDFGELASDGRLRRLVVFLGPLPSTD